MEWNRGKVTFPAFPFPSMSHVFSYFFVAFFPLGNNWLQIENTKAYKTGQQNGESGDKEQTECK